MGYRDWELPDEWTHKPVWCPPYPIPLGFYGNLWPYFTKKDILGEPPKAKYYFFDTPDYADCHKKVYSYTLFGTKCGLGFGAFWVAGNKQLSYLTALGKMGGFGARLGGTFMIYSATVCFVANFRGKKHDTWEHPWNHILGGLSTGLIWAIDSTGLGFAVGCFGALMGVLNLRANTPTPNHPNGWLIFNLPHNGLDEPPEANGALGGRNYRDWRFQYRLSDPGRKGLE